MNGDPMDMFDEMDEMFARLFSRMNREYGSGNPQVYSYQIVFRGGDDGGSAVTEVQPSPSRVSSEPVAEIHQIGDEIKVISELPGATDETIRLEMKGSTLVIDAGDAEHHYHATADLPPVDTASMQRSFRNGVLEITFRILSGAASPAGAGS